jgi:hypothetical protein
MTKSGQARSYRAYAQRDASAGSGDACNTNKDYVFEEAVGGFAITYLGDNEAHSSGTNGGMGSGGFACGFFDERTADHRRID